MWRASHSASRNEIETVLTWCRIRPLVLKLSKKRKNFDINERRKRPSKLPSTPHYHSVSVRMLLWEFANFIASVWCVPHTNTYIPWLYICIYFKILKSKLEDTVPLDLIIYVNIRDVHKRGRNSLDLKCLRNSRDWNIISFILTPTGCW